VREVRSLGLILAVEFNKPEFAQAAKQHLFADKILSRPLGSVLYLMPPLVISDQEMQQMTLLFEGAVKKVC